MSDSVPLSLVRPRVQALYPLAGGMRVPAGAARVSAAWLTAPLRRVRESALPGQPPEKIGSGVVKAVRVCASSSPSKHGLDLIAAGTDRFWGRAGGLGSDSAKGLVALGTGRFWASDGDTRIVTAVDVRIRRIVASLLRERGKTTDELTDDPRDHLSTVVAKHKRPPTGPSGRGTCRPRVLCFCRCRCRCWITSRRTAPSRSSMRARAAGLVTGRVDWMRTPWPPTRAAGTYSFPSPRVWPAGPAARVVARCSHRVEGSERSPTPLRLGCASSQRNPMQDAHPSLFFLAQGSPGDTRWAVGL